MGLTDNLLVGAGAVLLAARVRSTYLDAMEERRRNASPLSFEDGLTREEFSQLAQKAAQHTPRIAEAVVASMTVHLHIRSNSGLSTWHAKIDFNDYGHLTGRYWVRSDNEDSLVPAHFADKLQAEVRLRVRAPGLDATTAVVANPVTAPPRGEAPGRFFPDPMEARAEVRRRFRRITRLR